MTHVYYDHVHYLTEKMYEICTSPMSFVEKIRYYYCDELGILPDTDSVLAIVI